MKKLGVCKTNKNVSRRQCPSFQSLGEDKNAHKNQIPECRLRHHPLNLKADKFRAMRKKLLTITIKLVTSGGSKD